MSSEEPDYTALDAYIRAEFAKAAKTYESSGHVDARLQAILASGEDTGHDNAAAEAGGGSRSLPK